MTTENRLAKPTRELERNPLTDAAVAREWAGWAAADGKPELAAKWAEHAAKLGG